MSSPSHPTMRTQRQLRSAWTEAWEQADLDPLGMPLQGILYADPQVRIARGSEAGDGRGRELAAYFVGQVVGRLDAVRPTSEVVREMVGECATLLAT